MTDSNLTLADIAAVTNGNNGGMFDGANGGMWIFALLILLLIGGGGLFGNNQNAVMGERVATQADIQRAVDFDTLKSSISGVNETTITTGANTVSAVKDMAYNQLGELRDVQSSIATGFANMQTCCCETQRNIDSVKYDMANYAAAVQANDTANTQKVLDAIANNRMADMQNQINQLQLAQATCGIPRISTFAWGTYPYTANAGCGCSANM